MRGVPAWALKAGAAGVTILVTVAATGYIGAHVKPLGAPLRPALRNPVQGSGVVGPALRTTTSQPVTTSHTS